MDTGTSNDAAGLFGRFGGAPALSSPASAGVHGESAGRVGVLGLTDTGVGVTGGAGIGVGVQGYATTTGANSIAVQAVHLDGGTALDIRNGTARVSGTVRTAFTLTLGSAGTCWPVDHPLLNDDPTALVFVTPRRLFYSGGAESSPAPAHVPRWYICTVGAVSATPIEVSVLVIKQGPP